MDHQTLHEATQCRNIARGVIEQTGVFPGVCHTALARVIRQRCRGHHSVLILGAVACSPRYRRATMHQPGVPEKPITQAVAMFVASDYLKGEILLSDGGLNLP
jgi:hypothetical protein